jgi:hypothetical protein
MAKIGRNNVIIDEPDAVTLFKPTTSNVWPSLMILAMP